jgi:DNA repair exonuclease SbcCD ATPase subunit
MSLSLKQLTLHNFRGIRETLTWQFHNQPGFYFIQGKNLKEPELGANGAGKSTIFLDGPYWVLTGKTILSQRPGTAIENWSLDKASVFGEVTLTIDDEEYVIKRGRNPSVLTINGRTVEQVEIDKLIPLSDSALRRTLLLGQRSQMFLDLRPEEKSRLFSETLDLDVWLRASDNAGIELKKKELELNKWTNLYTSITGSMNEVRDQHEAAIEKEAEFAKQQTVQIAEVKAIAQREAAQHDTLKNTLQEAQTRLNEISERDTSEDELRTVRARERAARDTVVSLKTEQRQVTLDNDRLKRQFASYTNAKVCPECGQSVSDEHADTRTGQLAREIDRISGRILQITLEIAEHELSTVGIIDEISQLEEKNKSILELTGNVKTLQQQVLSQERLFIRAMQDVKRVEETVNPFSAILDKLEVRYQELKEQRDSLLEQETALNTQIEILKFWQKGFRDIRLEQIDTTLLELEVATNRNATALGLENWEIQFATERETKSGTVSHAFSIFLFPPGQNSPIPWENYSGGEAQRWQLAVTFGLSEVLLSRAGITPDFEILDEPTTFLSQEGIDSLLEVLHDRAHELQRRIYLIDHRSLDRGAFDGIVTVVKDNSGIRIDA